MVLITRVLRIIRSRFPYLYEKSTDYESRLTEIAVSYISQVESAVELRWLLHDKTLVGEKTLELFLQQKNMEILSLGSVQKIIMEIWEGPYEIDQQISNRTPHLKILGSFVRDGLGVDYERSLRLKQIKSSP